MTFLQAWLTKPVKDSIHIFWVLVKVMIPIMIIVRLAEQWGMINHLSLIFTPFMDLIGLPAEAGLIWSTAMLVNIYAGMVAFVALFPDAQMNVAQVTILGTMILVAHSLPMEQRIVQRAGVSIIASTLLRVGGAMVLGAILNIYYKATNSLQNDAVLTWAPDQNAAQTWLQWLEQTAISLFWIFWIILALVYLLKIMDALKVTALISYVLAPFLRLMGISPHAIPTTMIGVMLGISYGGALIMKEAKEGRMSSKDIFLSLSFLCLFHSAIEDTLLIFALGADLSGILVARFLFGFVVVALLGLVVHRLPTPQFERYLCKTNS